jgi:hypothetical protein
MGSIDFFGDYGDYTVRPRLWKGRIKEERRKEGHNRQMATGPDLQCVGVFVVHTDRESDLDVHTRTGLNQRYVAKNQHKSML